jgi:hypothetical protein
MASSLGRVLWPTEPALCARVRLVAGAVIALQRVVPAAGESMRLHGRGESALFEAELHSA